MHYKPARGAGSSLAEGIPGFLFCLPEQSLVKSSVHGSLLLPLTRAKLDPSALCWEAASTPATKSPELQPPAPACVPQDNETTRAEPIKHGSRRDASTITDVCTSSDVPEVEIISLLQEQLPHYTLRADSMFGYEHDDWLQTPLLPQDLPLQLTPEQITETLNYFLLCSERVGRITKTYRDIEAVTSLLEEKERDLELAARIGQSLLKQNRELTDRNLLLEEQLEASKEEASQLRHEASMREDLLHLYISNSESEPGSTISTPLRRNESSLCLQHNIQLDSLQQKLKYLEDENQHMRSEASDLLNATCDYEEQESSLMLDCVEQFSEASRNVALLAEEVARRGDDVARQQEEISQLLAQIVHLQQKCRNYLTENEELQQHLSATKEREQEQKTRLQDLVEKHKECEDMLHEAQEELKNQRNRSLPNSTVSRYSTLNIFPLDSLAAEIEGTMRKGMDASSELKSYKKVFETVKAANQAVRARSRCQSPIGSRAPSQRPSAAPSRVGTPPMSFCEMEGSSLMFLEEETLLPGPEEDACSAGEKKLGRPGTPGSQDLAAALQRLHAQRNSNFSENIDEECEFRLPGDGELSSGLLTPNESILSTGTNYSGISEVTGSSSLSFGSRSGLPEKLQIVKPLEGSATLMHWQQLAKPNLGGILDHRPGVLTKDFLELDIDQQDVYNLNDIEEDDLEPISFQALASSTPTKSKDRNGLFHSVNNLPQTPSTFTITTCRKSLPMQDITMVTSSLRNTVLPSCRSYESLSSLSLEPQRQTPKSSPPSDQTDCGESTPLGLVTLLKEHGISANAVSTEKEAAVAQAATHSSRPSFLQLGWKKTLGSLGFALMDSVSAKTTCDSVQKQKSNFSLNLVEQLRRLGLNQVVERAAASLQNPEEPKLPPR
ncbi:trafficking kinesin-binding protein 1 isoform X1 [Xenopus laevis]|uniref:Trafficking kinesin-binding protein 1 isoform X1 n=1 Tax=Xenopus laevis TaxID=8355 RepID=A0A8J0TTS4_XENLA|nr:trafficking kinesin-binding protein 1 isoform X1 [Xenopus laevis]